MIATTLLVLLAVPALGDQPAPIPPNAKRIGEATVEIAGTPAARTGDAPTQKVTRVIPVDDESAPEALRTGIDLPGGVSVYDIRVRPGSLKLDARLPIRMFRGVIYPFEIRKSKGGKYFLCKGGIAVQQLKASGADQAFSESIAFIDSEMQCRLSTWVKEASGR